MKKKNTPRDVFLHLFSMVALYWSTTAFIALCWQYANYWFPISAFAQPLYEGSIRFAVASLVVMFPLYLLSTWYLHRIYKHETEARESRIRKWLIYLTLFITAIIIVIDLVTVIYNFLGGDVTAKFIVKATSVLLVVAAVFGYYLIDLRKKTVPRVMGIFGIVSAAVVLIAIIGAFLIVGSPQQARQAQFDQQRIQDLQQIQYQIINYWQRKGTLPASLPDLNDSISGYTVPTDPETRKDYVYSVIDEANVRFALCADFDLAGNQSGLAPASAPNMPAENQSWNHPAGHFCFGRQIDRQLYPPIPSPK